MTTNGQTSVAGCETCGGLVDLRWRPDRNTLEVINETMRLVGTRLAALDNDQLTYMYAALVEANHSDPLSTENVEEMGRLFVRVTDEKRRRDAQPGQLQ